MSTSCYPAGDSRACRVADCGRRTPDGDVHLPSNGKICAKANMKIMLSALLFILVQKDIYKEGKAQLYANHYDEAEADLQLLGTEESSSKGYEGLALVEIARKNYDKALENANKAV